MRVEAAVRAFNADLRIVAFDKQPAGVVRVHSNLWGRAVDYRDTRPEPPYGWTKSPSAAPETGADVEIDFERGLPVAINRVPLDLTELIEIKSIIAGQHGVGRIAPIADTMRAGESHRSYEVPAATVLHTAHDALELASVSRDLMQLKQQFRDKYVELVVHGLWFTQLREALDGFNEVVQREVNGTIRVQLRKGECTVAGVRHRKFSTRVAGDDIRQTASGSPTTHAGVAARSR
jgi:argininosuccinate synthase